MAEANDTNAAFVPADINDVQNLLRAMGQVMNNIYLYGAAHKVTQQSILASYAVMEKALLKTEVISFSSVDGALLTDGRPVEVKNPLVASFAKKFISLEIAGFSLTRGMPMEEFQKLLELFNTNPEKLKESGQSFTDLVGKSGLQHVQTRAITYQRVTESEVVVNKGKLEEALGGKAGEGEGEEGGDKTIEEIILFLRGEAPSDTSRVAHEITEAAADTAQLADMILKAALIQQQQAGLEGAESLVDIVVGCFRRAYEGLIQDPAAKTQQGKKELSKKLLLLEEDVLKKIRELSGAPDDTVAEPVVEAVEEMTTELAMEALAADYMRKYKGIETTEKKILRFIRTVARSRPEAEDGLKERLMESGLTPEGWEELVIRSKMQKGRKGAAAETDGEAAGVLAMLLSNLDQVLSAAQQGGEAAPAEQVDQAVHQVSDQVATVVAQTQSSIEAFGEELKQLEAAVKESGEPLRLRRLIEILAEIVQEFCQPLSVINASVDMIRSRYLGDITPQQAEMLGLAAESGARLRLLVDRLLEISGVPVSTKPDQRIIGKLYQL